MANFTAIPVGQGDAFLLTRAGGTTILVDGGRSRLMLPGQVVEETSKIDVVVCTHADADHAEGLIGLFESSFVPVHEVWLPGRWASRIVDLCRNQEKFFEELFWAARKAPQGMDLEKIANQEKRPDVPNIDDSPEHKIVKFNHGQIEDALECEGEFELDYPSGPLSLLHWVAAGFQALWIEAVETAVRIRSVARAAHHHGARIRWFDFDKVKNGSAPSGGEAFLRPLNSVELTEKHTLQMLDALDFVALSKANRESLVFLAPETNSDSPVIFAADSDLACGGVPRSSRTLAVTAPHHGSEANKEAYSIVSKAAKSVIWVRSDGNYKQRPGQSFLGEATRVCTLCRNGSVSKQPVRLDDSPSGWGLAPGVRTCICK